MFLSKNGTYFKSNKSSTPTTLSTVNPSAKSTPISLPNNAIFPFTTSKKFFTAIGVMGSDELLL